LWGEPFASAQEDRIAPQHLQPLERRKPVKAAANLVADGFFKVGVHI